MVPFKNGVMVMAVRALPPSLPLVHVTVASEAVVDATAVPMALTSGKVVGVTGAKLGVFTVTPKLFCALP